MVYAGKICKAVNVVEGLLKPKPFAGGDHKQCFHQQMAFTGNKKDPQEMFPKQFEVDKKKTVCFTVFVMCICVFLVIILAISLRSFESPYGIVGLISNNKQSIYI